MIELARKHANERAVIEARTIYIYAEPFEVTHKPRKGEQALYVALPPSQHVAFRMSARMSKAIHYLDSELFPGGEILCGRALSPEEFKRKSTKDPNEVTCNSCLYALTLRSRG